MRLRNLRDCSQQELADALGVSRKTISSWENGHSEPNLTINQFKILLKKLKVTPEQLPDCSGPQPIHQTSHFFDRRITDRPT